MDDSITIRPAVVADVAAINELYNYEIRTGVASFDEVEWPFERRLAWFEAHQSDAQPVLVAEDRGSGEVIGFASLTLMSDKTGYRFTRENTVILRPEYHRRGIGRAIMSALIDAARAAGLRLIGAVGTSTNVGSLELHKALGYEYMGTL
jgi:phosphinothricin acetyltransferase